MTKYADACYYTGTKRYANANFRVLQEGNIKKTKGEIMVNTNQCEVCRYGGHGEKCCKAQGGGPKYTSGEKCPLYAMSARRITGTWPSASRPRSAACA